MCVLSKCVVLASLVYYFYFIKIKNRNMIFILFLYNPLKLVKIELMRFTFHKVIKNQVDLKRKKKSFLYFKFIELYFQYIQLHKTKEKERLLYIYTLKISTCNLCIKVSCLTNYLLSFYIYEMIFIIKSFFLI